MQAKTISRICKSVRESDCTDPRKVRRLHRAVKFLIHQNCRASVPADEINKVARKLARKSGLSI